MKKLLFFIIFFTSKMALASSLVCSYSPGGVGKTTKISFDLPEAVKFGLLVPIEIRADSDAAAVMNTVVIKDYPYIILSDVYRIETENSKIILIKLSPDRSKLEIAYVNMGIPAKTSYYRGSCERIKG